MKNKLHLANYIDCSLNLYKYNLYIVYKDGEEKEEGRIQGV
jgi:hypothetical protein